MRIPPDIGQRIRAERERRQLTQRQLAARSGISLRHLIQIEAGENFTVAVLLAIKSALADDLFAPFLPVAVDRADRVESTEQR